MTRILYIILAALAALLLLGWLGRLKETATLGWQHRTYPPYEPDVNWTWHPESVTWREGEAQPDPLLAQRVKYYVRGCYGKGEAL